MRLRDIMPALALLLLPPAIFGQAVPVVSPAGIVNAASFRPMAAPDSSVAAGSIISIFGQNLAAGASSGTSLPLQTSLRGASVTIGGRPAPLFYVSPSQINAQVPWATAPGRWPVIVRTAAGDSKPVDVRIADFGPGLFSAFATGRGPGAILNAGASGTLRSNSFASGVKPGGLVVLYGTGFGAVTPAAGDGVAASGLVKTNAKPAVTIGDRLAEVQFSGLAPGYAGLYQINAVVPPDVPEGCFVPVQVSFGAVVSNTVTLSVNNNEGSCAASSSGTIAPASGQKQGYAVVTHFSLQPALPVPLPIADPVDNFSAAFIRATPYTAAGISAALPPANAGCIVETFNLDTMPSDIVSFIRPALFGDPLDAGTLTLTGPFDGSPKDINTDSAPGYQFDLGKDAVQPGAYTLEGRGGKQVGAFRAVSLNVPSPWLAVRDWGARLGTISRASNLTAAWSCPDADAIVSYAVFSINEAAGIGGSIYCSARCADERITVPSGALQSLPPSTAFSSGAALLLQPSARGASRITASGLDLGFFTYLQAAAVVGYSVE